MKLLLYKFFFSKTRVEKTHVFIMCSAGRNTCFVGLRGRADEITTKTSILLLIPKKSSLTHHHQTNILQLSLSLSKSRLQSSSL